MDLETCGLGALPLASTVHLGEKLDSGLATAGGGSAPDIVTVVGSQRGGDLG